MMIIYNNYLLYYLYLNLILNQKSTYLKYYHYNLKIYITKIYCLLHELIQYFFHIFNLQYLGILSFFFLLLNMLNMKIPINHYDIYLYHIINLLQYLYYHLFIMNMNYIQYYYY